MKTWKLIALACGISITMAAIAGGLNMRPGLWKIDTKTTITGMPFAMPPRISTLKKCFTAEQIQHPWRDMQNNKSCKFTDLKVTGNSASWKLSCTGENAAQGKGSITIDSPTEYHGQMSMKMTGSQSMSTHAEFSGHRIGNCKSHT